MSRARSGSRARPRSGARLPLLGLAFLVLAAGCAGTPEASGELPEASGDELIVAAASDLRPAFEALADAAEEATGREITYVFGSSGQLAQQAREGAPMDVFASADAGYVEDVLASGRGDPDTQTTYAFGRVVLWAREDAWGGWGSLQDVAEDERVEAFAIANPDHAPYGVAGQEALQSTGAWDALVDRVVYGENIADAHRLISSGNADAGVTALSLAIAADLDSEGRWLLLDADLHAPLRQDLVVVADEPDRAEAANAFVEVVTSGEGREVMREYGFLLPGDDPPDAWDG